METTETKHLTEQEATAFFTELYYGEHHIPNYKVEKWGYGWCVIDDFGQFSTWDYNNLTRFVLMCHEYCVRGHIEPVKGAKFRIAIWKRKCREGSMDERHPTIEQAIEYFKERKWRNGEVITKLTTQPNP